MIRVEITNRQKAMAIDRRALLRAVQCVLRREGVDQAEIDLAVVDNLASRELNRRYLKHDYPTDVLSFALEPCRESLEGQIAVNGQFATEFAESFGWSAQDELLLYVIHGLLHLLGYDDASPADRARMRRCERLHLASFGLTVRYRPNQ